LSLEQSITIRVADAEDIPRVIDLERRCDTAAHWSEKQYRDLFHAHPPAVPIALIAEGMGAHALLGFLIARYIAQEWELENIVVAPDVRGWGIGKRLMLEFLARAEQTGSQSVFLEVRESNIPARRLYESLRFNEIGRRKGYYANPVEDAVLYSKTRP
jgi:[ribosomal protein S18]-alanine N-acetyltransferase